MPAKKKTPTLRWKKRPQKKLWKLDLPEWFLPTGYDLQEWNESSNRYTDIPVA